MPVATQKMVKLTLLRQEKQSDSCMINIQLASCNTFAVCSFKGGRSLIVFISNTLEPLMDSEF